MIMDSKAIKFYGNRFYKRDWLPSIGVLCYSDGVKVICNAHLFIAGFAIKIGRETHLTYIDHTIKQKALQTPGLGRY